MKKLLALTILALTLSTGSVFAQDAAPEKPKHEQKHGGKMFAKMDTDKDGIVTKEEFMKIHEEHFALMDGNGDGKVTQDEAAAAKEKMKAMREKAKAEKEKLKAEKEKAAPSDAAPPSEPTK